MASTTLPLYTTVNGTTTASKIYLLGTTGDSSNELPYTNAAVYATDGALCAARAQFTSTQDASGTADNQPALIIGDVTSTHLEFDPNEIMAKASGTTVGTLNLNADGGNIILGKSNDTAYQVTVRPTTASSSTTTGALVVNGGAGIAGAVYTGSTITAADTIKVTKASGAVYSSVTRSDIGMTLSLCIGSTGTNQGLYSSGYYSGSAYTSGNKWIIYRASDGLTKAVDLSLTGTTASSSTSTGALIVAGGAGIAGNLYATNIYGTTKVYSGGTAVKTQQSAVSDPSASGTGITYITTISQNANGVITPTKSTVRSASASQSGVVTTGTQTFAGAKTFTSDITIARGGSSRYKYIYFDQAIDTHAGSILYDTGDATKITTGRFHFREYGPKATAGAASTGYYEAYRLPAVSTAGLSANANYDIITTKGPIIFYIKQYTYKYSIAANGTAEVTAGQFNVSTPSGYAPFAIRRVSTGSMSVHISGITPQNTTSSYSILAMRNVTSSALTPIAAIEIIYIKKALWDDSEVS